MKIKTSDLSGAALDWAVARALGMVDDYLNTRTGRVFSLRHGGIYAPSTDWAQGGPIIGQEGICLDQFKGHPCRAYLGTHVQYEHAMFAPEGQPLVAAMRCFVASRLGDEVDVPEELLV